jgi:hypothetical protein
MLDEHRSHSLTENPHRKLEQRRIPQYVINSPCLKHLTVTCIMHVHKVNYINKRINVETKNISIKYKESQLPRAEGTVKVVLN